MAKNRPRKFNSGGFFHVFNKSISNFGIFRNEVDCQRFIEILFYYNSVPFPPVAYSVYIRKIAKLSNTEIILPKENSLIKFIAFCIMPDHYHLLVKILENNVFSKYISDVENSYTRFFNIKYNRKGPLWQSRFKSVRIKTDEQLLHVSRYIHLNPPTNNLVSKPEQWPFSSYQDYINSNSILSKMKEISINNPKKYQEFCEKQIDYQKKLKRLKKLFLE